MTQLTRTERRRLRTRDTMLEAGYELVAEHGVHAWPITDVADKADVALGSFYNHFADREEFVSALVTKYLVERHETFLALIADGADFVDALASSFAASVDIAIDEPKHRRFVVAIGLEAIHAVPEHEFQQLAGAVESGSLAATTPSEYPGLAVSVGTGMTLSLYRHIDWNLNHNPDPLDRRRLRREIVRLATSMAGAHPEVVSDMMDRHQDGAVRPMTRSAVSASSAGT